ncbi:MAG: hypothetical protein V9E87_11545 [Gemmatimonadales bacterium]
MSPLRTILGTTALIVLSAANLSAQELAPATPRAAPAASFAVTPMPARLAAPSASALVAAELVKDVRLPAVARAGRGQSSTLMIVGGAAIVTGLLLDEGVITFVGAGVWLYGLYLYLR